MPCLPYLSADRALTLAHGLQTGAPGVTMTTRPAARGEGAGFPPGLLLSCSLPLSTPSGQMPQAQEMESEPQVLLKGGANPSEGQDSLSSAGLCQGSHCHRPGPTQIKAKSPQLSQPARPAMRNWRKRIWQHPEGIKYSSQLPISKIPAEYTH